MLLAAVKSNDLMYYNVGNGQPYTVLEVVSVVEKVTGKKVPITLKQQRPGDPPILYSDPAKIKFELGWRPRYPDLETMVAHGWRWRNENYGAVPAPSIDPLMHNGRACTTRGCTENGEHESAPPPIDNPKIVIVGAGPTGLCAAYRLTELGYTNWKLLEGSPAPAGLACSIKDEQGFWWDIGAPACRHARPAPSEGPAPRGPCLRSSPQRHRPGRPSSAARPQACTASSRTLNSSTRCSTTSCRPRTGSTTVRRPAAQPSPQSHRCAPRSAPCARVLSPRAQYRRMCCAAATGLTRGGAAPAQSGTPPRTCARRGSATRCSPTCGGCRRRR